MTLHAFSLVCGWVGVSLGLWGTFAQFQRARTIGVEGVSLATWVLFILMGSFWMSYGLAEGNWLIFLGSGIIWPLQWSVVWRLKPWQHWRVVTRSAAVVLTLSYLPIFVWGWSGGVAGTGIVMLANRWPQLIELIQQDDASGVSTTTWATGFVGSCVWTAYYFGAKLHAAMWSNIFTGLMNFANMAMTIKRHRQAKMKLIAEEVF